MKAHLNHIRALSTVTGESFLGSFLSLVLLLLAAWGWCNVVFGA